MCAPIDMFLFPHVRNASVVPVLRHTDPTQARRVSSPVISQGVEVVRAIVHAPAVHSRA